MVLPVLQVVQLVCIGVLRCKVRVTERYVRGVADVLETVELSTPRATQTAGIVYLNLLSLAELVAEEGTREQFEEILACEAWQLAALLLGISE